MVYFWGLFLVLAFLCALTDFIYYKIPNVICGLILSLFLLKVAFLGFSSPLLTTIIAFGVTFIVGFLLFALKAMGAGDAKFLTVCMPWIVDLGLANFMLSFAIYSLVFALFVVLGRQWIDMVRAKLLQTLNAVPLPLFERYASGPIPMAGTEKKARKVLIPYGVPIFIAIVVEALRAGVLS
ncbi:MAG: prepilin peptidase [Holosporales bacterium]